MVDYKCICSQDNLQNLAKTQMNKLGSKDVEIRQEAMRLFISIMKSMSDKDYLSTVIPFLTSHNWRIREEILNLMIINILNKVEEDFDYTTVIIALSRLMNDDNAKVRFVARETLATLATKGDKQKVLEI